jgi:putative toxin-antitoxin system antitoxin component (TIGR02293 family)
MKTAKKKVRRWSGKKISRIRVREHAPRTYGSKAAFLTGKFAPAEAIQRVGKGLPFKEIEMLRVEIDEPLESLGRHLSISRSTLQRRRAERRLSPQESDRVLRFSRLLRHATKVFGDVSRARQWLKFPQRGLGGAVPLDYASTEVGAREVENLLGRIDYGVYS